MIQIAIVDDELDQIQKIQQIVEVFFDDHNLKFAVSLYTNGEDFLTASDAYDLFFWIFK